MAQKKLLSLGKSLPKCSYEQLIIMLSNNFNYDLLHDFMRKYWYTKHYLLSITHVLFLKVRGAVIFEQCSKFFSIVKNIQILKNKTFAAHVII